MRYAMEVDRHGSISRAAEALYMNQPNLSKAIRDLEGSLGITIFKRTSKGVAATQEGERFLSYARSVLAKIDEMEALYKPGGASKQSLHLSAPHSGYIAKAFSDFAAALDIGVPASLRFCETGAIQAVRNITERDYKLGVIRYRDIHEGYYLGYLNERELGHTPLLAFESLVTLHRKTPQARSLSLDYGDLEGLIEIVYEDALMPGMASEDKNGPKGNDEAKRQICVSGRAEMMDLLAVGTRGFAWSEPIPKDILECFGLTQKKCGGINMHHKDILIYPLGYSYTPIEKTFINVLEQTCHTVQLDLPKTMCETDNFI